MSSDLRGGNVQQARGGNSNMALGTTRPPQPEGSPSIRGPKDIMRARQEREARRKLEQEEAEIENLKQRQRVELELEARQVGGQGRAGDKMPEGTGATGDLRGLDGAHARPRMPSETSQRDRRTGATAAIPGRPAAESVGGQEGAAPSTSRPPRHASGSRPHPPDEPNNNPDLPQGDGAAEHEPSSRRATTTSAFPHAFERWETLSAHWEGLTSFWIRRLEANSQEIDNNPLSQQLSRQVTDLSAAGANLFHAVVELQRLRASSERKFQRWFFETRQEQEAARTMTYQLEQQLLEEREKRVQLINEGVVASSSATKIAELELQFSDMKRELTISRDESRRAWEELGRREQEERERIQSLRDGRTTLVGGVSVVPMMQNVPSRRASNTMDTFAGSQPQQHPAEIYSPGPSGQQPSYRSAPAGPSSGEYEVDPTGQYRLESQDHDSISDDEYDVSAERDREILRRQDYVYPVMGSALDTTEALDRPIPYSPQEPADYSGDGYIPGWENVPRHHHPTRLSDVLEEDERSRTSASQISRRD